MIQVRLIDADALRERIITRQTEMSYEDAWALTCVDNAPTIEPQKWIPVSEGLPDVAQRVLLSGHGKVMIGRLHSFGKYSLEPTGISYIYPKDAIEAWMPLPNPYKEEEE